METKSHFSPTQIDMYFRCGLQYQFRYMEGKRKPPAVAMLVGKSVHKSIEVNLGHMIDADNLPAEKDAVLSVARDTLANEWLAEEPELNDGERERGKDAVKGNAIDNSVIMAGCHYDNHAPKLKPTHVEREMKVITPDGYRDILGVIDIVEANSIRDTKTKSKSPTTADADTSTQLTFYSLASYVIDGVNRNLYIDAIVKTLKSKDAKIVTLQTSRTNDDWQRLLNRTMAIQNAITAGVFLPAAPGAWICSERWCGYWDICDYGKKQRKVM